MPRRFIEVTDLHVFRQGGQALGFDGKAMPDTPQLSSHIEIGEITNLFFRQSGAAGGLNSDRQARCPELDDDGGKTPLG
jgi:hypothetical protein